jgi:hypothetical protein
LRFTPQILLKIARDTVEKRKRTEWDLLTAYLTGSLLDPNPLLGGTADIDLVFVHNNEPQVQREVVPVSQDVHLDIVHYPRTEFHAGRKLRTHPYFGPEIYRCQILYDPQHFMDFIQAGVRGQFSRPDYVYERAQTLVGSARAHWRNLAARDVDFGPLDLGEYLDAVECAANSFASLSGPPLPVRRLLADLPARAEAISRPGLIQGILGLLGGADADAMEMNTWLPDWRSALRAAGAQESCPMDLLPPRRAYYRLAIEYYLSGESPFSGLWPLARTWTQAAACLPEKSKHRRLWSAAMARLGLSAKDAESRLTALDAFIDTLEDVLETWARKHGA